jgi:hypothetical protein
MTTYTKKLKQADSDKNINPLQEDVTPTTRSQEKSQELSS